jgi:hypothetical protein
MEKFDKEKQGIQLVETKNEYQIYSDVFRTIPLFIAENITGDLILFSDFTDFYSIEKMNIEIDKVGFWEIVLFGSGLWTRTLYKNVKQLPSASKIIIEKYTQKYRFQRYWDFFVEVDPKIKTIEHATSGLDERLDEIFSAYQYGQPYMLGLSGGMDSRITLAYLSKYLSKEDLKLFTFGYDEEILEYRYSKEVAKILGFEKPKFHKLTKDSYINAKSYLPKMSGGQIGIDHCHILDFFQSYQFNGMTQISTYFSDAIFGWDCLEEKLVEDVRENPYTKKIEQYNFLEDEVRQAIYMDASNVFSDYSIDMNFSCLSEYKYVTERNAKFHTFLGEIQGKYIPTKLPYANLNLLKYTLSIPINLRAEKKVLENLLETRFNKISDSNVGSISSKMFRTNYKWSEDPIIFREWMKFKLLNRANALFRLLLDGKFQLFNKFQTETQEKILRQFFLDELREANDKFLAKGLMTKKQKLYFDRLPLGSAGTGERFGLLTIAQLI